MFQRDDVVDIAGGRAAVSTAWLACEVLSADGAPVPVVAASRCGAAVLVLLSSQEGGMGGTPAPGGRAT